MITNVINNNEKSIIMIFTLHYDELAYEHMHGVKEHLVAECSVIPHGFP